VASDKKTSGLPGGIFAATTRPEPEAEPAEQGGSPQLDDAPGEGKASKGRKKKTTGAVGADVGDDGAKLYLTPDVRFRLRMLAYQRGKKISAVANEVLDKALPKWSLERTE
jgi:hypothetical protein